MGEATSARRGAWPPANEPVAVLAVDDSPVNLMVLEATLKELSIELVSVRTGRAALAEATARPFAVILLDLMMPEMDGLETLARLRMIPGCENTPVVLLTAFDSDGPSVRRAYALGAVDYLIKPFEPEVLVAKVRAFVVLQEQARAIQRQAEALKAKDRYIAMLAHDLRSPLSVVRMAGSRLLLHADPAVAAHGRRIVSGSARAERLLEDVLEFARAAAGRMPIRRAEFDLSELCLRTLEELVAVHSDVVFTTELDEPVVGHWDEARMLQALSNLLTNAVRYGNGWVHVAVQASRDGAVLSVENGGEPIPPAQMLKLFQPFERGDRSSRGIGLGLYIVREIALAHGGVAEARSDATHTCFRLRLPCQPPGAGASLGEPDDGCAADHSSVHTRGPELRWRPRARRS